MPHVARAAWPPPPAHPYVEHRIVSPQCCACACCKSRNQGMRDQQKMEIIQKLDEERAKKM